MNCLFSTMLCLSKSWAEGKKVHIHIKHKILGQAPNVVTTKAQQLRTKTKTHGRDTSIALTVELVHSQMVQLHTKRKILGQALNMVTTKEQQLQTRNKTHGRGTSIALMVGAVHCQMVQLHTERKILGQARRVQEQQLKTNSKTHGRVCEVQAFCKNTETMLAGIKKQADWQYFRDAFSCVMLGVHDSATSCGTVEDAVDVFLLDKDPAHNCLLQDMRLCDVLDNADNHFVLFNIFLPLAGSTSFKFE
nr:hypothetical protein BaRGS_016808 [Batillaria attramentaria]